MTFEDLLVWTMLKGMSVEIFVVIYDVGVTKYQAMFKSRTSLKRRKCIVSDTPEGLLVACVRRKDEIMNALLPPPTGAECPL